MDARTSVSVAVAIALGAAGLGYLGWKGKRRIEAPALPAVATTVEPLHPNPAPPLPTPVTVTAVGRAREMTSTRPVAPVVPALIPAEQAAQWLAFLDEKDFLRIRILQTNELTMESFAKFFAEAGLTPEQVKHLAILLTEKRLGATNVAIAQIKRGILPDPESAEFLGDLIADRARVDQETRAFLGEPKFQELKNYLRGREEAATLTRVDRAIGKTPAALSESQTAQLLQLMRQSPTPRLSVETIERTRSFLSAPQVEALKNAYEQGEEIFRARNQQALPPRPPP